jgi:beta-glucanase (GH16 family)
VTAPRHGGRRRLDRTTTVTGAVLVLLASAALVAAVTNRPSDATSGSPLPVGNLAGWQQTFSDDFTTPVAAGHFADSAYASRWSTYDGFSDTAKIGVYSTEGISVSGGVLDMDVKTVDGVPRAAAVVPLVDGQWGGQRYGRFSVRMQADAVDGYGAAFLLWSDANDWNDGEVDFPEGSLNGTISANNHCPGDPEQKCVSVPLKGVSFQQWHTYTIDWTPDLLAFEVDGRVIASTTSDIPRKSLHWVMQVGTVDSVPPASAHGRVRVDWATVYRYAPGTIASGGDATATATAPATPADDRSGDSAAATPWWARWWARWS